jgi:hypothetical protein
MPHRAAAAIAALLLAHAASAAEVAGVQVPDTITVAGKELKLNGAGVRKKFVVKVYVGALYLPAPASDAAAIVRADEQKSVHMRFLRGVSRDQVMDAFRDGFRNNGGEAEAAALGPSLNRVAPIVPRELKQGEQMFIDYVPGTGTIVTVPTSGQVIIEGKRFADAIFLNWLGSEPADSGLKDKMLGR